MYYPGSEGQLSKIRYAEILEEAAQERACRRAGSAGPKPSTRLVLVFAVTAPIVLAIISTLMAR